MDKRASPVDGISIESIEISMAHLPGVRDEKLMLKFACRRNYVIDFSNFQVNISINIKFHPGRRDEK